jgi:hypothetical protein
MRQRSIRSTHWSGHPDHPREGGDGQFVLRGLTGKTTRPNRTNLAPQESPESPQYPATLTATQADVADQPEGWQCNAGVRKRNADGTRCATQRNARFGCNEQSVVWTAKQTQHHCNVDEHLRIAAGWTSRCMPDADDSSSSLEKGEGHIPSLDAEAGK